MFGRRKLAALVAEFLGTGILTATVLSVQHSGIGYPLFIAMAAGIAVALFSYAVGESSGGYFNPAIAIGQWTAGKVATVTTILYVAVELLGAWAAYFLYTYLVNNHLGKIGGKYSARILIAEIVGTAIFGFVFASAVNKIEKGEGTQPSKSAYIGIGLFIGALVASSGSVGLLNPALALGVRAWVWSTYVVGPILGAVVGTQLYVLLFTDAGSNLLSSISMTTTTGSSTSSKSSGSRQKISAKKSTAKKK
ncbi:MAG: aquaporin [Candidatus Saccharimonadales bacterium]